MSLMARQKGARGVVVCWRSTRDSQGIKRIKNWCTFARYTTPIESMSRNRIQDVGAPIRVSGAFGARVLVRSGDWIFADDDAVLVISNEIIEAILVESEKLQVLEEKSRVELEAGEDINDVSRRYRRG